MNHLPAEAGRWFALEGAQIYKCDADTQVFIPYPIGLAYGIRQTLDLWEIIK